jgi:hypothetical protein
MTRPIPGHPLGVLQGRMFGQQVAQWQAHLNRPQTSRPDTTVSEQVRRLNELYRRAHGSK